MVDELNPALNFTRREVESLLHFVEEEPGPAPLLLDPQDKMEDIIQQACNIYPHLITKVHMFLHIHSNTCTHALAHTWYHKVALTNAHKHIYTHTFAHMHL